VKVGAAGAYSLAELVKKLVTPRFVWLMLPAGTTVDDHIESLSGLLQKGDTIIDGGNSFLQRRAAKECVAEACPELIIWISE